MPAEISQRKNRLNIFSADCFVGEKIFRKQGKFHFIALKRSKRGAAFSAVASG
jgi:hypothetical protein